MKLLLDFGNTRLKYAIYAGHSKITEGFLTDLKVDNICQIPHFEQVDNIHLSAVIEVPSSLLEFFSTKLIPNHFTITGNGYDVSTLGEDRILLALGAGPNHLVICLGTCITYNLTDESHAFIGGAISPGLGMRGKSMHEQTANLPLVIPQINYPYFGSNTSSNLAAGIMAGVEFEIKGFVKEAQKRIPDLQIILTGGDAQYFEHLYPVDPDLVWKGMLSK